MSSIPLLKSQADVDRFIAENEGLDIGQLLPLPHPYEDWEDKEIKPLSEDQRTRIEPGPDGVSALQIPVPENEEKRQELVAKFLDGIRKLLTKEDNWTFLQPLMLSLESCVKCQTCAESCPIYTASGRAEIYRPTFRPEVLRKIINRYIKPGGNILPGLRGNDVELTWDTVVQLAELSYRCTLCRRCAQACPVGVDNALVTREIRKLFSQELGINMPELHEKGTVKQLNTGSSTGLNPAGVRDVIEFAEDDIKEKTGLDIKIPFDLEGAEYLVMHNAGEFLSWPENLQAFSIILTMAGIKWTLASDLLGYDSVNYGLFYDDVQYSRIAIKHYDVAKRLGVKKFLMGECGHAHKATIPIADRVVPKELYVPGESIFVLLEDLVCNGKLKLDPSRNDFPITLHDPCNVTRSMGIIEPQRNVLKAIAPQFREMEPHGVHNLCCGGGSGFAVNSSMNFRAWRTRVSGRLKFAQILDAFADTIDEPKTPKYVCAPCSNCKGQMRDILDYYQAWPRVGAHYGGLVELVVNAMADIPEGFLEWAHGLTQAMTSSGPKRNPLLALEDWWTVWFGLTILLIATLLGILYYTDLIPQQRVPKLGRWVSNPADVSYAAKRTTIPVEEPLTLTRLAEKINAAKPLATAEIVPVEGGVRLRVASTRAAEGETISFRPLLAGGEKLELVAQDTDPGGMGARSYLSQPLPSADTIIGQGRVTVTAQRTRSILPSLIVTVIFVMILTAIGLTVMGQSAGRYALAFLAIFALAIIAFACANQVQSRAWGLSYAAWALVFGLIISNTVGTPEWLKPGVRTEMYIKVGLVLLGAEILFGKILSLGPPGLIVAWVVTPTVIVFMWLFGTRVLKMVSKPLVIIIAAATSVCGVSAAIAAAAASRAKKEELTMGVGMTLIFTVLMMIFMPMFIGSVGMDDVLGGAWMGGTIDSTGAVVAAGAFLGPDAETVAAVVKMIQNVLIGLVGFFVALFWVTSVERDPTAPRPGLIEIWTRFPKFILGFVSASILFSFLLTPLFGWLFDGDGLGLVEQGVIKPVTNPLRGWFFCLAFVSIGLESNFKELARQMEGGKPMLLYVVGQSFNLALTLLMAWLAFQVFFPHSI